MPVYRNDGQRVHARVLRASMTPRKGHFEVLRAHRFMGLSARRQAPLGPWIVDFVHTLPALCHRVAGRDAYMRSGQGPGLRAWRILGLSLYLRPSDVLADLPLFLHRLAEEIGQ